METLAIVEILGRRGEVVSRERIRALPAVIGRAYDADIIIDDEYVAPHHLQIDASSDGKFRISGLEDRHGFTLPERGRWVKAQPAEVATPGEVIRFGHTQIRVWRPDSPVAPTLIADPSPVRTWLIFLLWTMAALGTVAIYTWMDTAGVGRDGAISTDLMKAVGFIVGWSGIWWMCSKHSQKADTFIAHAGVAASMIFLIMIGDYAANALAFAFNLYSTPWDNLNDILLWMAISFSVYRHLKLVSRKKKWVLGTLSGLFVAALLLPMIYSMEESKREKIGEMQIPSSLKPPWMRVVDGVTPDKFVE